MVNLPAPDPQREGLGLRAVGAAGGIDRDDVAVLDQRDGAPDLRHTAATLGRGA